MRIPFLGGIGVPELIIILIVVLLIFGPKNLPKLGNAIGRTVKSMRDGMDSKKKQADNSSEQAEAPVETEAETEAEAEAAEVEEPAADTADEKTAQKKPE